jgi:hypothetical protein
MVFGVFLKKNIMKKVLLILAISLLFPCNKDDDNNTNVLVGNWEIKDQRDKLLNGSWSDWYDSFGNEKSLFFTDNTNVKIINYDNSEIMGTYSFDEVTKILITTFPSFDFPISNFTLISIEKNQMILQKEDTHEGSITQYRYDVYQD